MKRSKTHLAFLFLSIAYFISRLYLLKSDYNIFDSTEIFSHQLPSQLLEFSLFPYLVNFLELIFKPTFLLLIPRSISIISGFSLGLIIYIYSIHKEFKYNYLIILFAWFSPFVFYYSRIGQNYILAVALLFAAFLFYPLYKNKILTLSLFLLSVLINPQLLIFFFAFYLLFTDKHTIVLEELAYLSIPTIILFFFNPYLALLIISPILAIYLIYLFSKINILILLAIVPFFLGLSIQAYQSTIHTSLLELNEYLGNISNIYYQYPIYTTFDKNELSLFFQKNIQWLPENLHEGGLLITDDISSLQLNSKAKQNAYLVYQNQIPQSIQKKSFANSLSYFPAKYDKNTYRLYLILSDHDKQTIFGQIQN